MTTIAPVAPVIIGPQGVPERTLGWAVLKWSAQYLLQPDGFEAGRPWRFTKEQANFILHFYELDEAGRFVNRYAMFRRMKGAGKDPMGAAICAIEFIGPCRFAGWDKHGEPIGEPVQTSWVQIAAVSKEQTRGTMQLFPGFFSKRAIDEYRIDLGKEIIYAHGGRCQIQSVTSSPHTLEGARATFTLKNETHWWLEGNDGHEMAAVISRNAAKVGGRVIAISNAHNPGEDSDAERDWDTYQRIAGGQSRASGFLYDSREAPPDIDLTDRDSLIAGLLAARGDSVWLDVERLADEVYDPRNPASTSRRFYLNQILAAEDAWIAPHQWNELADPDYDVPIGAEIALAFDGSATDDHSALAGCVISSGHLFTIGIWDPEQYGGEAPRELIDEAVARAFAMYDVVAFYSDLHPWESYVDKWTQEYGSDLCVKSSVHGAIAWDMRGRQAAFTVAAETFEAGVVAKDFMHDGNMVATQHVLNARRRPNRWGVSFGKEHRESSRKVDFAAAAVLARLARQDYMALPDSRKRRRRTGRAVFA